MQPHNKRFYETSAKSQYLEAQNGSSMKNLIRDCLTAIVIITISPRTVCAVHDQQDDGQHGHDHVVKPVQPAEAYAPSARPDRIILTLNEDPRTTQTVNWRTSTDVVTGLAEIAEAGFRAEVQQRQPQLA